MNPQLYAGTPLVLSTSGYSVTVPQGTTLTLPSGTWSCTTTSGITVAIDTSGVRHLAVGMSNAWPHGPAVRTIPDTTSGDIGFALAAGFTACVLPLIIRMFRSQPLSPQYL